MTTQTTTQLIVGLLYALAATILTFLISHITVFPLGTFGPAVAAILTALLNLVDANTTSPTAPKIAARIVKAIHLEETN